MKLNPALTSQLKTAFEDFQKVTQSEFENWNRNDQIAFLANAYNLFSIQLIVDNYPVDSIKDIGNPILPAKKRKFFSLFQKPENLLGIEHTWVKQKFKDPRIYFLFNSATSSGPGMRKEAITGSTLEQTLFVSLKDFFSDPSRNRYVPQEKTIYLSPFLNSYTMEFKKVSGSIEAFVAPYITQDPASQANIRNEKVKIEYTDYDSKLNDEKNYLHFKNSAITGKHDDDAHGGN